MLLDLVKLINILILANYMKTKTEMHFTHYLVISGLLKVICVQWFFVLLYRLISSLSLFAGIEFHNFFTDAYSTCNHAHPLFMCNQGIFSDHKDCWISCSHALLCSVNVYYRPSSGLLSLFTGLSLLCKPFP